MNSPEEDSGVPDQFQDEPFEQLFNLKDLQEEPSFLDQQNAVVSSEKDVVQRRINKYFKKNNNILEQASVGHSAPTAGKYPKSTKYLEKYGHLGLKIRDDDLTLQKRAKVLKNFENSLLNLPAKTAERRDSKLRKDINI